MDLRRYGRIFLMFLILVLLQVMIINNINIGTWGITPMFYTLFILALPFETPRWALLVMSFILGFTIDVFCDTPGLNAGASTAMAFARPWILGILSPRDGYENGTSPYLMYMGFAWYIYYSSILVLIHHTVYFVFDVFGFEHFLKTIGQIILTTLLTEVLVIISQYISFRK
ncbi:MAG: rod shape-determining protein MreD [Bacteroidales bacterium]|nr:rod shape-determining protein MreD [Bacteroidales bacterium]